MTTTWIRWLCLAWVIFGPSSARAVTPQISAGVTSTAMVKQDGTMWFVGYGALQPTRLFPALTDIIAVSADGRYALRANGDLWTDLTGSPRMVLDNVTQFSATWAATMVLKADGTVWAWGKNDFGQLGDGTLIDRTSPVQVHGLGKVKMITIGDRSGTALTDDGTVWAWGSRGFFADGDTSYCPPDDACQIALTPRKIPIPATIVSVRSATGTLALDTNGRLWSFGGVWMGVSGNGTMYTANQPVQVNLPGKVKAFSPGWSHDLAITDDGAAWAWGSNFAGQLGVPPSGINPTPERITLPAAAVDVAAGWSHSAVLLADGRVLTFGDDSSAQLGRGLYKADSTPGSMVGETGAGQFNVNSTVPAQVQIPPRIVAAANGNRGPVPLTLSLSATASGNGGHNISRIEWVSSDGSVSAQGDKVSVTLTKPGAIDIYAVATDDTGLKSADVVRVVPLPAARELSMSPQISGVGITSIALTSTGKVIAWGAPWNLGSQTLQGPGPQGAQPLPVEPQLNGILTLASSATTTYALTSDGLVLSWGFNINGELGSGSTLGLSNDPVQVLLPKPAKLIAGSGSHALALLQDGTLWAWGGNSYGQLGLKDTAMRNRPIQVNGVENIVSAVASDKNSYAIDRDGAVSAWGDNSNGQLGQGDTTPRLEPIKVPGLPPIAKLTACDRCAIAIARDGRVFGWGGPNTLGDQRLPLPTPPTQVPVLQEFKDFVSGSIYTLGTKKDGTVWAWGDNWGRQIPGGTSTNGEPIPILVPGIVQPLSMTASGSGGGAVLSDGSVVTWGGNNYGQIGDGTYARRLTPTLVLNLTGTGFLDLLPGVTSDLPPQFIPPFLGIASWNGDIASTTLSAKVSLTPPARNSGTLARSPIGRFAAANIYQVYVAASVPNMTGPPYWYMLSSANSSMSSHWGALSSPLAAYLSNVIASSPDQTLQLTSILQDADLTGLSGAEIYVGYGTDATEMLTAGRYRTILTVP